MTLDLDERARRVKALLETFHEPYPAATIASDLLAQAPGLAPGSRVPCTYCLRTGRLADRYCPVCLGHGWRKRKAGEDAWDEYTGAPIRDDESAKGHAQAFRLADDFRKVSAELARVSATLAQSEGRIPDEPYAWESAKRRYWRHGSYGELAVALSAMADRASGLYGVIRLVYLSGLPADCIQYRAEDEQSGRYWLAEAMRGPIRIPRWIEEPMGQEKRKTVAELVAAGLTPAQVARVLRIPKEKARRMCRSLHPVQVA